MIAHVFDEEDMNAASGPSPHCVGVLEALAVGREPGLSVPKKVMIVAVEVADSSTIGAAMHEAVRAAVPAVVSLVRRFLDTPLQLVVRSGMGTGGP